MTMFGTIPTLNTLPSVNTVQPLSRIEPLYRLPQIKQIPTLNGRQFYKSYNPNTKEVYRSPFAIDSLSDVLLNKEGRRRIAVKYGLDPSKPLDSILTTLVSGVHYVKESYLKPIVQGDFLSFGSNALMSLVEDLDVAANVSKGAIIEANSEIPSLIVGGLAAVAATVAVVASGGTALGALAAGFVASGISATATSFAYDFDAAAKGAMRGLGIGDEGKYQYEFNSNNKILNFLAEVAVDPLNWLSFSSKLAIGATKMAAFDISRSKLGVLVKLGKVDDIVTRGVFYSNPIGMTFKGVASASKRIGSMAYKGFDSVVKEYAQNPKSYGFEDIQDVVTEGYKKVKSYSSDVRKNSQYLNYIKGSDININYASHNLRLALERNGLPPQKALDRLQEYLHLRLIGQSEKAARILGLPEADLEAITRLMDDSLGIDDFVAANVLSSNTALVPKEISAYIEGVKEMVEASDRLREIVLADIRSVIVEFNSVKNKPRNVIDQVHSLYEVFVKRFPVLEANPELLLNDRYMLQIVSDVLDKSSTTINFDQLYRYFLEVRTNGLPASTVPKDLADAVKIVPASVHPDAGEPVRDLISSARDVLNRDPNVREYNEFLDKIKDSSEGKAFYKAGGVEDIKIVPRIRVMAEPGLVMASVREPVAKRWMQFYPEETLFHDTLNFVRKRPNDLSSAFEEYLGYKLKPKDAALLYEYMEAYEDIFRLTDLLKKGIFEDKDGKSYLFEFAVVNQKIMAYADGPLQNMLGNPEIAGEFSDFLATLLKMRPEWGLYSRATNVLASSEGVFLLSLNKVRQNHLIMERIINSDLINMIDEILDPSNPLGTLFRILSEQDFKNIPQLSEFGESIKYVHTVSKSFSNYLQLYLDLQSLYKMNAYHQPTRELLESMGHVAKYSNVNGKVLLTHVDDVGKVMTSDSAVQVADMSKLNVVDTPFFKSETQKFLPLYKDEQLPLSLIDNVAKHQDTLYKDIFELEEAVIMKQTELQELLLQRSEISKAELSDISRNLEIEKNFELDLKAQKSTLDQAAIVIKKEVDTLTKRIDYLRKELKGAEPIVESVASLERYKEYEVRKAKFESLLQDLGYRDKPVETPVNHEGFRQEYHQRAIKADPKITPESKASLDQEVELIQKTFSAKLDRYFPYVLRDPVNFMPSAIQGPKHAIQVRSRYFGDGTFNISNINGTFNVSAANFSFNKEHIPLRYQGVDLSDVQSYVSLELLDKGLVQAGQPALTKGEISSFVEYGGDLSKLTSDAARGKIISDIANTKGMTINYSPLNAPLGKGKRRPDITVKGKYSTFESVFASSFYPDEDSFLKALGATEEQIAYFKKPKAKGTIIPPKYQYSEVTITTKDRTLQKRMKYSKAVQKEAQDHGAKEIKKKSQKQVVKIFDEYGNISPDAWWLERVVSRRYYSVMHGYEGRHNSLLYRIETVKHKMKTATPEDQALYAAELKDLERKVTRNNEIMVSRMKKDVDSRWANLEEAINTFFSSARGQYTFDFLFKTKIKGSQDAFLSFRLPPEMKRLYSLGVEDAQYRFDVMMNKARDIKLGLTPRPYPLVKPVTDYTVENATERAVGDFVSRNRRMRDFLLSASDDMIFEVASDKAQAEALINVKHRLSLLFPERVIVFGRTNLGKQPPSKLTWDMAAIDQYILDSNTPYGVMYQLFSDMLLNNKIITDVEIKLNGPMRGEHYKVLQQIKAIHAQRVQLQSSKFKEGHQTALNDFGKYLKQDESFTEVMFQSSGKKFGPATSTTVVEDIQVQNKIVKQVHTHNINFTFIGPDGRVFSDSDGQLSTAKYFFFLRDQYRRYGSKKDMKYPDVNLDERYIFQQPTLAVKPERVDPMDLKEADSEASLKLQTDYAVTPRSNLGFINDALEPIKGESDHDFLGRVYDLYLQGLGKLNGHEAAMKASKPNYVAPSKPVAPLPSRQVYSDGRIKFPSGYVTPTPVEVTDGVSRLGEVKDFVAHMYHSTGSIHMNEETIRHLYYSKKHLKGLHGSSENVLPDIFQNFEEYMEFVYRHEYHHTLNPQKNGETLVDYEKRINKLALDDYLSFRVSAEYDYAANSKDVNDDVISYFIQELNSLFSDYSRRAVSGSALVNRKTTKEDFFKPDTVKEFRGDFSFLSNFYEGDPIIINGRSYKTVEHYFQASKALSNSSHEVIRNSATPSEARRLGRITPMNKELWEQTKFNHMARALFAKFSKDPVLKQKLKDTAGRALFEGNSRGRGTDKLWGVDLSTGEGENVLGELLMILRDTMIKYDNLSVKSEPKPVYPMIKVNQDLERVYRAMPELREILEPMSDAQKIDFLARGEYPQELVPSVSDATKDEIFHSRFKDRAEEFEMLKAERASKRKTLAATRHQRKKLEDKRLPILKKEITGEGELEVNERIRSAMADIAEMKARIKPLKYELGKTNKYGVVDLERDINAYVKENFGDDPEMLRVISLLRKGVITPEEAAQIIHGFDAVSLEDGSVEYLGKFAPNKVTPVSTEIVGTPFADEGDIQELLNRTFDILEGFRQTNPLDAQKAITRKVIHSRLSYSKIYKKNPDLVEWVIDRVLFYIQRQGDLASYGINTVHFPDGKFAKNLMDLMLVDIPKYFREYFNDAQFQRDFMLGQVDHFKTKYFKGEYQDGELVQPSVMDYLARIYEEVDDVQLFFKRHYIETIDKKGKKTSVQNLNAYHAFLGAIRFETDPRSRKIIDRYLQTGRHINSRLANVEAKYEARMSRMVTLGTYEDVMRKAQADMAEARGKEHEVIDHVREYMTMRTEVAMGSINSVNPKFADALQNAQKNDFTLLEKAQELSIATAVHARGAELLSSPSGHRQLAENQINQFRNLLSTTDGVPYFAKIMRHHSLNGHIFISKDMLSEAFPAEGLRILRETYGIEFVEGPDMVSMFKVTNPTAAYESLTPFTGRIPRLSQNVHPVVETKMDELMAMVDRVVDLPHPTHWSEGALMRFDDQALIPFLIHQGVITEDMAPEFAKQLQLNNMMTYSFITDYDGIKAVLGSDKAPGTPLSAIVTSSISLAQHSTSMMRFADTFYREEYMVKNLLGTTDPSVAYERFQAIPGLVAVMLTTEGYVKNFNISRTDKKLGIRQMKDALSQNAILTTYQWSTELYRKLDQFKVPVLLDTIDRWITSAYKAGYLSSMGFVLRNVNDTAIMRLLMAAKGDVRIFSFVVKSKQYLDFINKMALELGNLKNRDEYLAYIKKLGPKEAEMYNVMMMAIEARATGSPLKDIVNVANATRGGADFIQDEVAKGTIVQQIAWGNPFTKLVLELNSWTEEHLRLAYLLWALDQGKTMSETVYDIAEYFVDYNYKSHSMKILQTMVPFSLFAVKNIQMWAHHALDDPMLFRMFIDAYGKDAEEHDREERTAPSQYEMSRILGGNPSVGGVTYKLNPSLFDAMSLVPGILDNPGGRISPVIKNVGALLSGNPDSIELPFQTPIKRAGDILTKTLPDVMKGNTKQIPNLMPSLMSYREPFGTTTRGQYSPGVRSYNRVTGYSTDKMSSRYGGRIPRSSFYVRKAYLDRGFYSQLYTASGESRIKIRQSKPTHRNLAARIRDQNYKFK